MWYSDPQLLDWSMTRLHFELRRSLQCELCLARPTPALLGNLYHLMEQLGWALRCDLARQILPEIAWTKYNAYQWL